MSVRKVRDKFEVKLRLTINGLDTFYCDTQAEAGALDRVSRVNQKVVDGEECELAELESALAALKTVGISSGSFVRRFEAAAGKLRDGQLMS